MYLSINEGVIKGDTRTRIVSINGRPLSPKPSQQLISHSPDGFNWGFCGSGPAQLALAILYKLTGNSQWSIDFHQQFKSEVIAGLTGSFTLQIQTIKQWIDSRS